MSLVEFFKNLVLDTWYKALVYFGGVVLILSLFIEVKGISNNQLQLLSTEFFLFGLGEWKNHKFFPQIKPPNVYTRPALFMNVPVWKPDLLGIVLDLTGIALLVLGIRSLVIGI
jgi:hypothetical protein